MSNSGTPNLMSGQIMRDFRNNPKMRGQITSGLDLAVESIVSLPAGRNRKYDVSDLNDGMMRAAILDTSVGGAANGMREALGALGDGKAYRAVPSDEWFRLRMHEINEETMVSQFKSAVSSQLSGLESLGRVPSKGLEVAIDLHKIPRYDRTKGPELARSRYKDGTRHFERYITSQAVNPKARLNLAALRAPSGTSGPSMVGAILDDCLSVGAKIDLALMDREFFAVQTINAMNQHKTDYLMPARNTPGITRALEEFAGGTRNAVSEYVLRGKKGKARCFLHITERKKCKNPEAAPKEKYIGFVTSVPDINLDLYADRWGIETGYSKVESMRAKTRSRNPTARLFCFLYSLLLFNMWVAINSLALLQSGDRATPKMTQTALKFSLLLWILERRPDPDPPPALLVVLPA